jgi:hypothetical protein
VGIRPLHILWCCGIKCSKSPHKGSGVPEGCRSVAKGVSRQTRGVGILCIALIQEDARARFLRNILQYLPDHVTHRPSYWAGPKGNRDGNAFADDYLQWLEISAVPGSRIMQVRTIGQSFMDSFLNVSIVHIERSLMRQWECELNTLIITLGFMLSHRLQSLS